MTTSRPGRWHVRMMAVALSAGVLGGSVLVVAPVLASVQPRDTTTTVASTTTTVSGVTTTTSGSTTTTAPTTTTTLPSRTGLPWPIQGSGAVSIPQLTVVASSPRQPRVPIASLTKMMTTWVVLQRRPLTFNQRGPCLTVTAHDYALWKYDYDTGQSNAAIVVGETLCEGTLLRGLLVHSAGDYAQLLSRLVGLGQQKFVTLMNHDAQSLGLTHTHYVDYTGISAGDVSTAANQVTLAVDLMNTQPIVRRIVAMVSVWLPVAGVVGSYTPNIGQFGVVGVKSGYTSLAGGCDVMAINVMIDHMVITTYAVVLGQFSANPLALAGQAALALSRSLRSFIGVVSTPNGRQVAWRGSPADVVTTTTTTSSTTTTITASTSSTSTVPLG